ncbi:MAG: DUF5946 family protein [Chthoniobacterales bacterium]
MTQHEAYDALCAYTLTRGDAAFIHQHVVDAFAAQSADEATKPITLTFALVGLYLHVERQFTGREVQRAHQRIARDKRVWPAFTLPSDRGAITAADVLARAEGSERDAAIQAWCATVWHAFRQSKPAIEELLSYYPRVSYDRRRKG